MALPLALAALAGCGSAGTPAPLPGHIPPALLRQARPIGAGARFQPPARGPIIGPCRSRLGRRNAAHVELFAANRVLIVPAGIGTRPPRTRSDGTITNARCYGDIVTIDPTGVVLVRRGLRVTLAQLFRSWGQALSSSRLASFRAREGSDVAVYVDGRSTHGPPGRVPLARHSEIVLEVGPHVPPHHSFTFPPEP